jgi:hypothetical protein
LSNQSKSRKSYEELVDSIIEALPVQTYTTIEEISRQTESSWETVYRWLKLIIKIQEMPRVEKMPSPYGRGSIYRRDRARYGSKKEE